MKQAKWTRWLAIVAFSVLGGCSFLQWAGGITTAQMGSAEVQPYLAAAAASPRVAMGFSPLPTSGPVGIELPRYEKDYDVMLHLGAGNVSRTVTFLTRNGRLEWIGEQEIHRGPRTYDSVDGTSSEAVVLSCSLEARSGAPKGCYASYDGPNTDTDRQIRFFDVTVVEAQRIWEAWDRGVEPSTPPTPAPLPPLGAARDSHS